MRFLTADYLFPLDQKPIKEGVVNVDKSGKIISVIDSRKKYQQINLKYLRV